MTEVTWSRERAIEGYLDALRGVRDLAGVLAPDEWAAATDLPAWTVFDNVAHVAAIEDELAGRPVPSAIHDWSQFPHVQTPFQQYTEVGVEARRGRQPSELVAELEALVDERARQLESVPDSPDAEMRGPAGMVGPVSRVMGTRTFDVWAHEQDIRRATGRAPRMTGPAAEASLSSSTMRRPTSAWTQPSRWTWRPCRSSAADAGRPRPQPSTSRGTPPWPNG